MNRSITPGKANPRRLAVSLLRFLRRHPALPPRPDCVVRIVAGEDEVSIHIACQPRKEEA